MEGSLERELIVPRHQLPALSPLPARKLGAALRARLRNASEEIEVARTLVKREFAADAAYLFDSGRSALQCAIAASIRHPHDVVALPAFQCFEVASAAVGAGCRVALYDVDPDTLGPDFASLEEVLKRGVAAVVIAPLYGIPVDWEKASAFAAAHGTRIIEDAAQANGAEWMGRRVGTLGSLTVLSFGRGKGWTGGSGGAICVRDGATTERIANHQLRASGDARLLALSAAQWLFGRPALYSIPASLPFLGLGESRYRPPMPPRAMSSLAAAVLNRTLESSIHEQKVRRDNARIWRDILPAETRPIRIAAEAVPGYLRFPIRVSEPIARRAESSVARRAGIARSYPRPLVALRELAPRLVTTEHEYPGAHALSRQLLTLPTHSFLAPSDYDAIVSLLRRWSGGY